MDESTKSITRKPASFLGSLFGLISSEPRTSSSKPLTQSEVRQWLIEKVAIATDVPPDAIDVGTTFSDFGLDSRTAVSMSAELEKKLGRELPPTLIWDFPTINELTQYLCAPVADDDNQK